ncbi:MAG: FliA/WhiG family RNA polymerase sigma factor [Desulfobacterales bacterium]|nr:FliA/WhiG family RNA polymerase sigma factor [Desulfobacterales bacterium]
MSGYKMGLTEEEKEKIIKDSLPFIKYTAYRLAWRLTPQLTVEDLISVGIVGLLDALQRFEQGRVKLNTFVKFRIKGAMLDELRAMEWMPISIKKKIGLIKKAHLKLERELGRQPEDEEVAESLKISLDEYYSILQNANVTASLRFENFNGKNGEDEVNLAECIPDPNAGNPLEIFEEKNRKELLACLIDELPEKEKLIFSLYYWDEMTMKEIGNVLNLTEGRVCQVHSQTLIRLKGKLSSKEKQADRL